MGIFFAISQDMMNYLTQTNTLNFFINHFFLLTIVI